MKEIKYKQIQELECVMNLLLFFYLLPVKGAKHIFFRRIGKQRHNPFQRKHSHILATLNWERWGLEGSLSCLIGNGTPIISPL